MIAQHAALAAADPGLVPQGALTLLMLLPLLVYVVLAISALVSVLSSQQGIGMKFVWIVLVFLAPFLGSLLWFIIGKRSLNTRATA